MASNNRPHINQIEEALAMDLERYGDVRVVSVEEITPWKQEVIERG